MRGKRFAVAGFLVFGMVALVQAQPGGFGGFGGPTFLVTNKAVQEDIKATEEQVTKLKTWAKDFKTTSDKLREDEGVKFTKGTKIDEEMQAKINTANTKITAEAYKQLGDILKKEQVDRVKQIERQNMGIRAFTNAEVVDALKLTDAQKSSVKGITGDYTKESKEIRDEANKDKKGGFFLDPETQKKIAKVQKEYVGKIVDVLDDTQKKTWKDMNGEAFDLTKLQFTFPKKDTPKKD
jgi:hypothetical protein